MADSSNFAQPSIPKFDGYYEHWVMLMENLLRSKEYWGLIENGVVIPPANATVEQQQVADASKLCDLKVKNYLFQSIDRSILETILTRDTAKDIWDAMKRKYQCSTKVKRAQLQSLRREFEILEMGESESVTDYFARTLVIANKMTASGELMENVYVMQSLGYQKGKGDQVYKLRKALYGLKQAPRAWYSKIESYFVSENFKNCPHEHTLFVKQGNNQKILIVSIYVDDLIYTGNDTAMMNEFKASMKDKFAMTDLGKMKYFLGVEVNQGKQGIFIHQQKYSAEILKRFGMEDCNKVCSPIVTGCKLVKDENGKPTDATTYKQMIGCLMYLLATRPDLTFAVCLAARYMERPTEMHVALVKRIMRYLKGTLKLRMLYKCKENNDLIVKGWSDSDYAGDHDDRKSTSGYVFTLGGSVICWSSKKQLIVTLSTTEAEFVSAASCAYQCLWLKSILDHLLIKQPGCIVINCDSSSSIKLSKNPILHGRCKHIDVRYHFLRDLSKDGIVELQYCKSHEQLADIMTKALKFDSFCKLREGTGMSDSPS
ncbi:copia-type polyprotein [Trifolium pratense]|uniref:Copia-type polyprotein n=1 Tax=Trifolium pratense TaxID=57577 RepID=A0A2K3LRZ8_TRIPR|nr:copia-type polyprotein [Trifolium pratense]